MKKNSFISGTFIAFLSLVFIKILGAIYVIPFYRIIGEEGGTLYSYAYNIYILFLNISTAGVPIAMSMIISEYNALEMYDAKERTYKIGLKSMLLLSILSFLVLFFFSNIIAIFLLSGIDKSNISSISLTIKAISLCLLIIPFLSILRGYLQGHKFITPTSISQIIEQVVRIAVVLLGSYLSIKIFNSSIEIGVSIALLGAFVGGLVAYLYLKYKINKNKQLFPIVDKKDKVSSKAIFKKIVTYSIPIVMISIITNLYTIVDIKLIIKGLYLINYDVKLSQVISSIVSTWAPKICTLIMAVSIALTTNIVPNMVSYYVKKDYKKVNMAFNQSIKIMFFVSIPISLLLFVLSDYAYYIFYGVNEYGFIILKYSAISHIFFGIWTVINSSLQSMKKFKAIYINSIIGLVVNALLDIPMILLLNKLNFYPYIGTIIATIIGCITSSVIVFIYLKKEMDFKYNDIILLLKKLIIPSIIMIVPIVFVRSYINVEYSYTNSILYGLIFGVYGLLSYLIITYKNNALYDALGKEYVDKILRKLHLIK